MIRIAPTLAAFVLAAVSCSTAADPFWHNATIYFMLPDRFANGDTDNDLSYGRQADAGPLRGFMGGDLQGVIDKLNQGYFNQLGVDAIWVSPLYEQIHGATDEGTGRTYAYHGYWPKDWTAVDRNFGSEALLEEFVRTAHRHGIRVLLDVIINHTGPVTGRDPRAPLSWVRTEPVCNWSGFAGNVRCTLVANLPDIRTESEAPVALPPALVAKWQREGRLEREKAELDEFFARTGYPRAPKYYFIKWVTDWVRDYGVDGFRVDTAKHVEPQVWRLLKREASRALAKWKADNPGEKPDDRGFFMLGEVYGFGADSFGASEGRNYDFGDRQVDFFDYGFDSLINFDFARRVKGDTESLFASYSGDLHGGALDGVAILNYLASHDDMHSFDRRRQHAREAATKLMLAPGAAQIYYGDELARPLHMTDAQGDAQLRGFMNWDQLGEPQTQAILLHWQKLGQFRQAHPAVGAGVHKMLSEQPYVFSRTLNSEKPVLVSLGLAPGRKSIPVYGVFADGELVRDFYSGQQVPVEGGKIELESPYELLLLAAVDRS
ncbi:alpha-amylase family glycosyl hydrolase [Microbulbifer sp. TYP-18]|uniref:alpha-amylase family glycosyl hydrolase n=1 Tax=Microbulbifer sp. TYP-18 TaxID=3230024 RepID=UPI0034C5DE70